MRRVLRVVTPLTEDDGFTRAMTVAHDGTRRLITMGHDDVVMPLISFALHQFYEVQSAVIDESGAWVVASLPVLVHGQFYKIVGYLTPVIAGAADLLLPFGFLD